MFNVNLLFNEDGSIKESPAAEVHKKELISHLGIKGFNYYFAKQQERIELWNENKEAYKELLETKDWSTDSKEEAFRNWILETSPFLNADKVINGSASEQDGIQIGSRAGYYNIVVPRRYRKDNSQTDYYDDTFLKIEENEDLLSFYTYITNLLRDLKYIIPADQRVDFRSNTLPDIKTSVIATLNRGFGDRARSLIDTLKKGMTDSDVSSFDFDEYNLKTGEKIRKAKLTAINNRGQQIQEYIRLKELQLGRDATPEELIKWKKEIVTKLAENKSYDPETMLRVFTSQIMAYKYNSTNESTLNILFEGLKSRKELRTNLAGRVLLKPDGTPAELEGGLRNLIDMVNYHWGVAYGEPRHKIEGRAKKKRYTTEEKVEMEKLKEIQHKLVEKLNVGKITKEDFDKEYEFLEAKLNSLGGYITASALGDIALKWYTYLGMSFNFIAGGVNLFTGAFENSLRGMDGRLFSNADLWMFYGKVITSSIPGYSSEETKKIKAINAKLDITQMAVNELYDLTNSSGFAKWKKKVAVANPFYINERTEYINQMPLALAYISNKKVFSSKDESIKTFYDAIDVNGNIKEGVILVEGKSNQQALIELKQQLDRLIKITHGNYSSMSPMMGKQTIIGRALLQFRGWMPEMINARFGPELQDNILGITIKGRYNSFSAAFSHSIVAGQTYSALQNTLFTLKQILRKLTFQKTQFEQRLSEVDAANMRANLQELFILSAITALFFAIKGLMPDDDDEPKYFVNIFLNMLTRYQSDILLYLNPAEFEKISKNVLPVTGLITNFSKFMDASWKYLIDGDEEDWDRFVKRTLGLFPILNQIPRTVSYGSQLFS